MGVNFPVKIIDNPSINTQPSLDELLAKNKTYLPMFKENFHIQSFEIFVFLRGEEIEGSDLDLFVTFSEKPGLFAFLKLENHLYDLLGAESILLDYLRDVIATPITEPHPTSSAN